MVIGTLPDHLRITRGADEAVAQPIPGSGSCPDWVSVPTREAQRLILRDLECRDLEARAARLRHVLGHLAAFVENHVFDSGFLASFQDSELAIIREAHDAWIKSPEFEDSDNRVTIIRGPLG